ncbi:hypothetical protein SAMN04488118_10417 [Epibacterium ulvae]|uniref:Uncharacterized protein n=1 Tax=Epibacterium ulvae TaxID=1156985 RepID=A0A1G5QDN1_9RHOB|nr:hypothetical protein [Epibacterium ulvae]SCZ59995.1 hypothetical protein SAMN04488118_10417 [Epibacterium ulvae]
MRVSKNNRTAAAQLLQRLDPASYDARCLRELVACYDNKEPVDEAIYSDACAILSNAFQPPYIPDEHGNPVKNPALMDAS